MEHALAMAPWSVYACFLIAPFVQEDAAVIGAAATSSAGMSEPALLFASVLLGLTLSDLWKYWAGRLALSHGWARRFADKPGVRAARDGVVNRLGASLMAVRFIPGTRIPFYVASGFFKAPFGKFAAFIALSGAAYAGAAFVLFHALGAVAGEAARGWLPALAIGLIVAVLAGQWAVKRWRPATPSRGGA